MRPVMVGSAVAIAAAGVIGSSPPTTNTNPLPPTPMYDEIVVEHFTSTPADPVVVLPSPSSTSLSHPLQQ